MNIIEIYKELIPYKFDFDVDGNTWTLHIKAHRLYTDRVRVDLINENGKIVLENQVCIQDRPLFSQYMKDDNGNKNPDLPFIHFIFKALDKSQNNVTVDTIQNKVYLAVENVV